MPRPSASIQRRNGPYAPLSAHYSRDDAVLALDASENDLAEVLFTRSLAYCAGDPRLDGYISDIALRSGVVLRRRRQERVLKAAEALNEVGIFVREKSGYRLRAWSKWNRTNAEIEQKREADRNRKGAGRPPEEPPPSDEEPLPPHEDSNWNADGFRAESEWNPDGTHAESQGIASRARGAGSNATHSNATQFNATQRSSSTPPAGGTQPPPPYGLPTPITDLAEALAAQGVTVSWQLDTTDIDVVLAALDRCGTHRLIQQAKARWQPNNPAHSAHAFLAGWATMPAPKRPEERSAIPCQHGADDARHCAFCRQDQVAV